LPTGLRRRCPSRWQELQLDCGGSRKIGAIQTPSMLLNAHDAVRRLLSEARVIPTKLFLICGKQRVKLSWSAFCCTNRRSCRKFP